MPSLQDLMILRRIIKHLSSGVPDEIRAITPQLLQAALGGATLRSLLDPDGERDPESREMDPLKEAHRILRFGGMGRRAIDLFDMQRGYCDWPRELALSERLQIALAALRLALEREETKRLLETCMQLHVHWRKGDNCTKKLEKIEKAVDDLYAEAAELAASLRDLVEIPSPVLDDETPIDVIVGHVRELRAAWAELERATANELRAAS